LEKVCSRCKELRPIGSFSKDRKRKCGVTSQCKYCDRLYYVANLEIKKAKQRKYRERNLNKVKAINRKYWGKCSDEINARRRTHWHTSDKKKEIYLAWKKANPEKVSRYNKKANTKRRSTMKGKLANTMSSRIRKVLKNTKNNYHWESLVGYTACQLKQHLEKQFKEGMTWENYGFYGWHIDHIIPISVFNFSSPDDIDFKRCWALSNLQPLWAKDNIKKHNNLNSSFQPSFSFSFQDIETLI